MPKDSPILAYKRVQRSLEKKPFWLEQTENDIQLSISHLSNSLKLLKEKMAVEQKHLISEEVLFKKIHQQEYEKIQATVNLKIDDLKQMLRHNEEIYEKALKKYIEGLEHIESGKQFLIRDLQNEAKEKFKALQQAFTKTSPKKPATNSSSYIFFPISSIVTNIISAVLPAGMSKSSTTQDELLDKNDENQSRYADFLTAYGGVVSLSYNSDNTISSELKLLDNVAKKSLNELKLLIKNPVFEEKVSALEADALRNKLFYQCVLEKTYNQHQSVWVKDFNFKALNKEEITSIQCSIDEYIKELHPKALRNQLLKLIQKAIILNLPFWQEQAWHSRSFIRNIPVPTGIAEMYKDFFPENNKNLWDRLKYHQEVIKKRKASWSSFWKIRNEATTGEFYNIIGKLNLAHLTQQDIHEVEVKMIGIGLKMNLNEEGVTFELKK